jgi:hypothetical protein
MHRPANNGAIAIVISFETNTFGIVNQPPRTRIGSISHVIVPIGDHFLFQTHPDRYTIHQLTNSETTDHTIPHTSGIQYAASPSTNQRIQTIFFSYPSISTTIAFQASGNIKNCPPTVPVLPAVGGPADVPAISADLFDPFGRSWAPAASFPPPKP